MAGEAQAIFAGVDAPVRSGLGQEEPRDLQQEVPLLFCEDSLSLDDEIGHTFARGQATKVGHTLKTFVAVHLNDRSLQKVPMPPGAPRTDAAHVRRLKSVSELLTFSPACARLRSNNVGRGSVDSLDQKLGPAPATFTDGKWVRLPNQLMT